MTRSQVPDTCRTGEQIGERRTLVAGISRKRDLRKVSRPGDADLRVGGNQILLRLRECPAAAPARTKGVPAGTSGACGCSVNFSLAGSSPGLFPRSMLMAFSSCAIWRSRSGISVAAVYTNCSDWRTSNIELIPCLLQCSASIAAIPYASRGCASKFPVRDPAGAA